MSGFSAAWLGLREPADVRARSEAVTGFLREAVCGQLSLACVDLGSGTGSNVRYLSSRLGVRQHWTLVDDEAELLREASARLVEPVAVRVADLRQIDDRFFAGAEVVTASALLDLVSEPWLRTLVRGCVRAGAHVLFALNYDGRMQCTPADPDDEIVRELVNAHQRTDKGFGPALGPAAASAVERLLREAGYAVRSAASDWQLGVSDRLLQEQLLTGWASAAIDLAPHEDERVGRWLERRLAHLASRASTLVVGHRDVAGILPRPGG